MPQASRSSPEILKTLLRKKACLYEPVTSRAVSHVAWSVGRHLALARGLFSRQTLQLGVHRVVSDKIRVGVVTRTKVNRCLQVVLNSCFHYVIPRVDGSQERGEGYRGDFARTLDEGRDDKGLLSLPAPWDDLADLIERCVDKGGDEDESCDGDNDVHGESLTEEKPEVGGSAGEGSAGPKRAVLLCFNENVRSASDVHRCHDEFVRDVARAANLNLGGREWGAFFTGSAAGENEDGVGLQMPSLAALMPSEGSPSQEEVANDVFADNRSDNHNPPHDVLGRFSDLDLRRFRTSWCAKRYDHDPVLCAFAHVEVNGGWLRRDTMLWKYGAEMCPDVVKLEDKDVSTDGGGLNGVVINACPHGLHCPHTHSNEEMVYHPDRYKRRMCEEMSAPSQRGSGGGSGGGAHSIPRCILRDVCPDLHPRWSASQARRVGGGVGGGSHRGDHRGGRERERQHPLSSRRERSPPRHLGRRSGDGRGGPPRGGSDRHTVDGAHTSLHTQPPSGPPTLYVGPAPESEFETSLLLPGLRALFRRNSVALWASHRQKAAETIAVAPRLDRNPVLPYTCFGNGLAWPMEDGG